MSFEEDGYAVVNSELDVQSLRLSFETRYLAKFAEDVDRNRNLIKAFTNDVGVREAFLSSCVISFLKRHQRYPLITGPVTSHYTSNGSVGAGFGLPFHQDWPSMATSSKSIVCWIPLTPVSACSHSIEVVPRSHQRGALPGNQHDYGYVVDVDDNTQTEVLSLDMGQILFMSAWLVHRTYINTAAPPSAFKLSLSQRFDDLEDSSWSQRNFVSAYSHTVDRELWLL